MIESNINGFFHISNHTAFLRGDENILATAFLENPPDHLDCINTPEVIMVE